MHNLAEAPSLLEFKGRMLMVTVLHLASLDRTLVQQQLTEQLDRHQNWIRSVPLVVEVGSASAEDATAALPGIIDLLRDQELIILGVAGNAVTDLLSTFLGLPRINLSGNKGHKLETPATPKAQTAQPKPSLLIDQPVRSGQQIYSEGDLVVAASVSEGAELLAAGNIHVYGNLRGRALAGVRGNTAARIFCQQLNAELVSIAGHYRVSEGLPEASLNQPVQISLAGESMHFTPFKH
jgi:septum site-determining protein MinC|nr:Septum site-determining protein MinC [uncultured bacterium]